MKFADLIADLDDGDLDGLHNDAVLGPLVNTLRRLEAEPECCDAVLILLLKRDPDGSVRFGVDSCDRVSKAGAIAILRGAAEALEETPKPCPEGCDNGRLPCVCDGTGWEWVDLPCTACKGKGWLVCDCAR